MVERDVEGPCYLGAGDNADYISCSRRHSVSFLASLYPTALLCGSLRCCVRYSCVIITVSRSRAFVDTRIIVAQTSQVSLVHREPFYKLRLVLFYFIYFSKFLGIFKLGDTLNHLFFVDLGVSSSSKT